jgi:hypothetical protein
MPCDQVRTTTLKVKAANIEVMAEALRVFGFAVTVDRETIWLSKANVSGSWRDGELKLKTSYSASVPTADEVAREYSKQSIVATARQRGWQVRFKSASEVEVTRRSF